MRAIMPDAPWLLDLFCCAGGASFGYRRAGFNVVGVDIKPQPHYPFTFVRANALDVLDELIANGSLWRDFRAIHASPPCQRYSKTQRIRSNEHPDLIGPTRERLSQQALPWVIENVEDARDELRSPVRLCGAMFSELRVYRHRLFESSVALTVPDEPKHTSKQAKMGRPPAPDEFIHVVGNFAGVDEARQAMGIGWANRDELKEAIPPAFSEYIGHQIMKEVTR